MVGVAKASRVRRPAQGDATLLFGEFSSRALALDGSFFRVKR